MNYDAENQELDQSNLFVSNFSWDRSEEDLSEMFAPYGELENVKLIFDRETGRSRGFGFVKFINADDAQNAMSELNGKEVDGREIRVSVARPRPPRENTQY